MEIAEKMEVFFLCTYIISINTGNAVEVSKDTKELEEVEEWIEECEQEMSKDIDENVAFFIESKSGKRILEYNGHRYRKVYVSRYGSRWNCSTRKECSAFVYLSGNDNEIIMNQDEHTHPPPRKGDVARADKDAAVIITSRKGKEMLLFHQYTYRKQYNNGDKTRWACSTLKNCHAAVFTGSDNCVISANEDHHHNPPKYYRNPGHVVEALRESLILETD